MAAAADLEAGSAVPAMPYIGLRPFEEKDHALFCGRTGQIETMRERLACNSFLAVLGSSGCGKSSLVRAGLIPTLRRAGVDGRRSWHILVMRPGADPYGALVRRLEMIFPEASAPGGPARREEIEERLRASDLGLLEALRHGQVPAETGCILVVDQFEELFAFRRAAGTSDPAAGRDDAAAFVAMLLQCAAAGRGRVRIIITMRSDFVGDCEAFLGLPEQVCDSPFLVPRLDRRQMGQTIQEPARIAGARFTPFVFEENLVNHFINDAGDRPDQLPLLQHALMRTWKFAVLRAAQTGSAVRVSFEDYEQAGGIHEALSRHAEEAWDKLADDERAREICRRLFILLCDISADGRLTRRRPRVSEVMAVTGATMEEVQRIVRLFQEDDRNFLLPPGSQPLTGEAYLDISHEALLRRWETYRHWQEVEREDARELRRLTDIARLYQSGLGSVLSEQDYARVNLWKARISPAWAARYVPAVTWLAIQEFLEASEVVRRRGQRRKVALYVSFPLLLLCVIALLTVLLYVLYQTKKRDEQATQAARAANHNTQADRAVDLADSLADSEINLTAKELAALWRLATLGPEDRGVREQVVDRWFKDWSAARPALQRDAQGLHAAIGLDTSLRARVTAGADHLIEENPVFAGLGGQDQEDSSRDGLLRYVDRTSLAVRINFLVHFFESDKNAASPPGVLRARELGALAAKVPDAQRAEVSALAARALEPQFLALTDNDFRGDLVTALAPLISAMDRGEAAKMAQAVAQILEKPAELSPVRRYGLVQALGALLERAQSPDTAKYASPLLRLLTDPQAISRPSQAPASGSPDTSGDRRDARIEWSTISGILAKLAPLMIAEERATFVESLAGAMEKDNDRLHCAVMGSALAALLPDPPPGTISPLAQRGANALRRLLDPAAKIDDPDIPYLIRAVVAFAGKLPPTEATELAGRAAEFLAPKLQDLPESSYVEAYDRRYVLVPLSRPTYLSSSDDGSADSDILASAGLLAKLLEPGHAANLARQLVQVASDDHTDPLLVGPAADAAIAVITCLDPDPAAKIADELVDVIGESGKLDASVTRGRVRILDAAIARMEPAAGVTSATKMAKQFLDETPNDLVEAGTACAFFVGHTGEDAAPLAKLAAALILIGLEQKSEELKPGELSMLGSALGRLALILPTDRDLQLTAPLHRFISPIPGQPKESRQNLTIRGGSHLRLVALSYRFISPVPGLPEPGRLEDPDRKLIADLCAGLELPDLTEILKWPVCVGEAQQIVLGAIEKKTNKQFDGDLWRFVAEAPSLGIQDLDAPAKRPDLQAALQELARLAPPAPAAPKPAPPGAASPALAPPAPATPTPAAKGSP